jgi:predicted nucleic acid-binding protein
MKAFFDTSSLFKLYHNEPGSEDILKFLELQRIESFYLAEITIIEFSSVIWRKYKKAEIDKEIALMLISKFEKDAEKFSFVPDTYSLKKIAKQLIAKYWQAGLRTLDSIQLASGVIIKSEIDYFFTSDKVLGNIAHQEGLSVL